MRVDRAETVSAADAAEEDERKAHRETERELSRWRCRDAEAVPTVIS